eukprot:949945-Rhodomonas_salina.3
MREGAFRDGGCGWGEGEGGVDGGGEGCGGEERVRRVYRPTLFPSFSFSDPPSWLKSLRERSEREESALGSMQWFWVGKL